MVYRLTRRARQDVLNIWQYIAQDNEPAADLYLANCYGEPIFTGNRAANLRKWAESHFRTLVVAVKRSEPRTTPRSRNSE
jgi:hypothetical protein